MKRYDTQCGNPYSCDYAETEDANGRFVLVADLPVEALENAITALHECATNAEYSDVCRQIDAGHVAQLRDLLLAITNGGNATTGE